MSLPARLCRVHMQNERWLPLVWTNIERTSPDDDDDGPVWETDAPEEVAPGRARHGGGM